ncbi:DNA mismatch repair endonuclease MutL [Mechercharimyces sp. CAU 1602]|uniref:DNA mismatch repair endonuclease MutL n=1 Tax=Mechercharimyces sp. CAU 1602 TaxID=2973933 RepID=UPI0021622450|nr:DNA mismatch repair endonuclease MutL [Mechercharimyces sp. CAU 1602]MCS1351209.1 DNA mismatch repair endonuclease MutL [Mechercharimyces sp. CAU 1602]
MAKIHIMDEHLANQIAAGEVVERPASVVKELVENGLDAKATRIQIEIEEGGIRSIRVSDNGEGMERSDVERAFSRHATSKIRRDRDLYSIRTLGFRGEALPSIASVARVTVKTHDGSENAPTQMRIEGGKVISLTDTAHPQGTEVKVEDLFFNTPARLKYLKTVNTEISHVADYVGRLALAHPEVGFLLRHNGKQLFHTTGDGKRLHAIMSLYGKQVASKMVSFQGEDVDYHIEGWAARPEVTRANRTYISTIINGRYVRSMKLAKAVTRAFDTLLPIGRFPIVVLAITMDPKLMDVNVHPAKLEVRLSKEDSLFSLIEQTLKKRWHQEQLIPAVDMKRAKSGDGSQVTLRQRQDEKPQQQRLWSEMSKQEKEPSSPLPGKIREQVVFPSDRLYRLAQQGTEEGQEHTDGMLPDGRSPSESQPSKIDSTKLTSPSILEEGPKLKEENKTYSYESSSQTLPAFRPLAQVHGTYIVAESDDGFYLVDQHAAHERIYYERFMQKMAEGSFEHQSLLVPLTLECTASEAQVIERYREQLHKVGVEPESFGGTTYLVRSHPRWFPQGSEEELIREMMGWLEQKGEVRVEWLRDEGAKMMACKAAIKANRRLRQEEMEALFTQLYNCHTPYTCPHGRPIFVHFSSYDLEKLFKRVM